MERYLQEQLLSMISRRAHAVPAASETIAVRRAGSGEVLLRVSLAVALLFSTFVAPSASAQREASKAFVSSNYKEFAQLQQETSGLPWQARTNRLENFYSRAFAKLQQPGSLNTLSTKDLRSLFDVTGAMAFYSMQPVYATFMRRDLATLAKRNVIEPQLDAQMYGIFIQLRQFKAAKTFAREHPKLDVAPLPVILEDPSLPTAGPTVLAVSSHGDKVIHRPAALPAGTHILVVGHPLCHFTQRAVKAIEQNPKLVAVFERHAYWVSPQNGQLDVDLFQRWNAQHPAAVMSIAYRQREWPLIDSWQTPTFYFIHDGRVAAKVTGWPKEGNLHALRAAMRSAGLLTDPAQPP